MGSAFMSTRQKRKSKLSRLIIPAVAISFFAYFGFHAVHGAYGLNAKMHLEHRAMELRAQLSEIVAEREALEKRVALLDNTTLERDMLDERARDLLNVARPDEIVIYR
jgi:cell division protein FtsB